MPELMNGRNQALAELARKRERGIWPKSNGFWFFGDLTCQL